MFLPVPVLEAAVFLAAAPDWALAAFNGLALALGEGVPAAWLERALVGVVLLPVVLTAVVFLGLAVVFADAPLVLVAVLVLAAAILPPLAVEVVLSPFEAEGVVFVAVFFSPATCRLLVFLEVVAELKSPSRDCTSFFTFLTVLVTASGIIGLGFFLVLGIVLIFKGLP